MTMAAQSTARVQPDPLRHAILIGVSEYGNWPGLPNAKKDVEQLDKLLRTKFGFNVDLITDAARTSRTAMISAVRDICFRVPPRTSLLIHFSGHGVSLARHQWLVPSDAPPPPVGKNERILSANYEDYLVPADFRGAIAESEAESTLFVIDACRTRLGRREASPFMVAPARADQKVILVHAARPGRPAKDHKLIGGLLTNGMVEALSRTGGRGTLGQIFQAAEKSVRKHHAATGVRIQCECDPDFSVSRMRFFSVPQRKKVLPKKAKRLSPRAPSVKLPLLGLDAFHKAGDRERRALAFEFLGSWYELARDFAVRRGLAKATVPDGKDERVYEDDDGFLDFNFWSSKSPINLRARSKAGFWYFLSLWIEPFDYKTLPEKKSIEIHMGAVVDDDALEKVAKTTNPSADPSADDVAKALRREDFGWRGVRENDFGNLQIEVNRFSLDTLNVVGKDALFEAFTDMLRNTGPRIVAAIKKVSG